MSKKHILWVDDDLMFYESYKAEASEICHVDVASSPATMWEKLNSKRPDYYSGIILDVMLPFEGIDVGNANGGLRTGLALLEMLRESQPFTKIPIIIFSIRDTQDIDDFGRLHNVTILRKSDVRIVEFIEALRQSFSL
jgi:CheY-like chemotaxis protein